MAIWHANKKEKLVIFGVILILVIGGGYFWYTTAQSQTQHKATAPQTNNAQAYTSTAVTDIPLKAAEFANKNDIQGGLAYYDQQIAQQQDPVNKRLLLIYKSGFALHAKQDDQALIAAQQAEKISPDISVNEALARVYEAQGNKKAAIEQYQKVLDGSPKGGMEARYNSEWQQKIKELQQ